MAATAAAASSIPAMLGTVAVALGLPLGVVWAGFAMASSIGFVTYPEIFNGLVAASGYAMTAMFVIGVILVPIVLWIFGWDIGARYGWWPMHKHHGHHGKKHAAASYAPVVHAPPVRVVLPPDYVPMFPDTPKTFGSGGKKKKGKGGRK